MLIVRVAVSSLVGSSHLHWPLSVLLVRMHPSFFYFSQERRRCMMILYDPLGLSTGIRSFSWMRSLVDLDLSLLPRQQAVSTR